MFYDSFKMKGFRADLFHNGNKSELIADDDADVCWYVNSGGGLMWLLIIVIVIIVVLLLARILFFRREFSIFRN